MTVESSPPPNSRTVYTLLITLGVIATLVAFSTIGFIAHQYVTREELRNPPDVREHSEMPSLSLLL
jgi:hypothetical protein